MAARRKRECMNAYPGLTQMSCPLGTSAEQRVKS